jgi:copper chaperone CopZ
MDSGQTAQRRIVEAVATDRVAESEPMMRQLSLFVSGMGCRRCVREVTARLRDVPGVEIVSADPGSCTVRLTGSMTVGDVLAAFNGTSYLPRLHGTTSGDSGDSAGTAFGKPGT